MKFAQFYVNEVVLGTAIGVLFGPYCANVFNPRAWGGDPNTITLEVMRITLAVGLFAIGVELPQSYLAEHAWGLLIMVVPTMAFGWLVVAGPSSCYICASSAHKSIQASFTASSPHSTSYLPWSLLLVSHLLIQSSPPRSLVCMSLITVLLCSTF